MVGRSLSPVRRRATHCRNVYATLLTVLLVWPSSQNILLLGVLTYMLRIRGFGEDAHPLLPPVKSNPYGLRSRDHNFQLPVCNFDFIRNSFIMRSLYRFQQVLIVSFVRFHDCQLVSITTDSLDSPDCLPILLSICVFYFLVCLFHLVVGSVR